MNATRTGRKPSGPQIAKRLEGSPSARQRLKVILESITGQLTIPEACEQLGIGESRFHDLRNQTLQATLESLEPRRLGRPPKPTSPEQAEIDALKEELRRIHFELEVMKMQFNLARIHPGLIDGQPPGDDLVTKKNDQGTSEHCQQRRAKRRRRRPN
jgi:hypothetical protein